MCCCNVTLRAPSGLKYLCPRKASGRKLQLSTLIRITSDKVSSQPCYNLFPAYLCPMTGICGGTKLWPPCQASEFPVELACVEVASQASFSFCTVLLLLFPPELVNPRALPNKLLQTKFHLSRPQPLTLATFDIGLVQ